MELVEVDGAGWRWMELGGGGWSWVEVGGAGWRWVELGGGEWSWVEVSARFSNTQFCQSLKIIRNIYLLKTFSLLYYK